MVFSSNNQSRIVQFPLAMPIQLKLDLIQCLKCKNNIQEDDAFNLTCKNFICSACIRHLDSLKSKLKRYSCPQCGRNHNIGNYVNAVNDAPGNIFDFHDDLIESFKINKLDIAEFNDQDLDKRPWLGDLMSVSFENQGKLGLLQININSLRSKAKQNEIDSILNTLQYSIVMVNETKLDDTFPIEFYKHDNYRIIRRDRGASGGGVLVFILKSLDVTFTFNSPDFEFIYFEIRVNKVMHSFICAYRSQKVDRNDFLNAIQEFLYTKNIDQPLFIVGDLNLDLACTNSSGKCLLDWMASCNLVNYVDKPTREADYNMKATNTVNHTSTLLDVVLHNKNLIASTHVIEHCISDHNIVIVFLDINIPSQQSKKRADYKCLLNDKTLNLIHLSLGDTVDIASLAIDNASGVDEKWLIFKEFILTSMIEHSKKCNPKRKPQASSFPWFDAELLQHRAIRDKLYAKYLSNKDDLAIKSKFDETKKSYNKFYRLKIIDYFKDKKSNEVYLRSI